MHNSCSTNGLSNGQLTQKNLLLSTETSVQVKMTSFSFDIGPNEKGGKSTHSKKWPWYGAPIFCAIWFALFYATVIPSFYSYPDQIRIRDEGQHMDEFIGEHAQRQLLELSGIGNKMAGSINNEVHTVNFLMREIQKIMNGARTDLYDIEAEVLNFDGSFYLFNMPLSYQNISSVVVKITRKNSPSESYLLVNSHYDSVVESPAAGDAGVMIVVMLETLRVIARSERPLANPIVFLFNGAEEANLLASHGFITQHKWAANCKALINLDSTGSGGREVLFQTGPNHPWLVKYYKQNAPHPFSTTMAEELFQNNFIPSDTDFRIFRDFGGVPGLDMAHALNGYVYHTKYDNFQNLERGTYQTTGDNVLAVTWALANAPELNDTAAHEEGHSVFYDYLGWFMICYNETTSIAINVVVSVAALILINISVYQMSTAKSADAPLTVWLRFGVIILVQVGTLIVAAGLTILVGVILQALNLTQSWYYHTWMTFGLYFCTMFFVLGLLPAFYIGWTKNKTGMSLNQTIACFLHAHCIVLVLICIIMTCLGIRSAFFPMIGIFFYAISIILQLLCKLILKKSYFVSIHLICQLMPFWFYTYMGYVFLIVFIPMQGRDGPDSKPELLISGFIVLVTLHFAGFLIPILQKFRRQKMNFSVFGLLTIIFIILAATPAAFPYKEAVAAQRYSVMHTQRTLHNADKSIAKQESGFYIQPSDTRYSEIYDTTLKNAEPESWLNENCAAQPYCGLPLYGRSWLRWKNTARWIYATPPEFPIVTELDWTSHSIGDNKMRYDFSLKAADMVILFILPFEQTKFTNWSMDTTPLEKELSTPYFIRNLHSLIEAPFEFWLELEHTPGSTPHFKLGVSSHFRYHQESYTDDYREFLNTFPEWTYTTDWIASYDSWII